MANELKNVKVSRDNERWEVEVRAEIPAEVLMRYRDEALKEIRKTAKLDGFRAGYAPEARIVQVYGEAAILREAAEHAIQHELPELLAAEKLLIIESPKVTTDPPESGKPASTREGEPTRGGSLVFTARAALAPRVELPDYKKIAVKQNATKEDVSVSDEEHQEALTHLRRERARIDKIESGTEPQKAAEESRAIDMKELPALDDAFVSTLGYENAEKFSTALRENIKTEKEMRSREKRRSAILDDLVKDSKINYPVVLREYELDDMEARMSAGGESSSGGKDGFEIYLKQIGKTREALRAEWKDAADKRARVRLILTEIARKELINADEKLLEKEVVHAREHYPEALPEVLRTHIAHAMRNDATLQFLEKQI